MGNFGADRAGRPLAPSNNCWPGTLTTRTRALIRGQTLIQGPARLSSGLAMRREKAVFGVVQGEAGVELQIHYRIG
jgi:hypothetical protein